MAEETGSGAVDVFEMDEPRLIGMNTRYGYWLTTEAEWVVRCTAQAGCIASVLQTDDEHDADEAWHWVRTLLEEERRPLDPDALWEEALRWIL